MYDALAAAATTLTIASPELLARRELLRRTDSKFIISAGELAGIVARLGGDYSLVLAGGNALGRYETLYFDTPSLRCYHDHRRGRRARHKVRIRHYPDRAVSFLEVKSKRSVTFSSKARQPLTFRDSVLSLEGREFVARHCSVDTAALEEQAWTNFHRLTLVNLAYRERVTIDCDLHFQCDGDDNELEGVGIIEVKQSPFCVRTPFMQLLRKSRYRPASMSKYMTTLALSGRNLRANTLRPVLRELSKAAKR